MTPPPAGRIARLRAQLEARSVGAFILQRTDQHGSEYLPASEERLAWLTGFTGSAGTAVVLAEKAAVFSDGRYTVQLAKQVDAALFERVNSGELPISRWLEQNLPQGSVMGFDPMLMRQSEHRQIEKIIAAKGGRMVALDPNPIDELWGDRPDQPVGPVVNWPDHFSGERSADKRQRMGQEIAAKGAGHLVVTAADAVAWLLNVRGQDIPYNPLCLSFAVLAADGTCRWFVDPGKLTPGLRLDNAVAIEPATAFPSALEELGRSGAVVLADPAEVHLGFLERLRNSGAVVVEADDPIMLAKAIKNVTEVKGAFDAQRRDGAAMVRFLSWLTREGIPAGIDEAGASGRLAAERGRDPQAKGDSFGTISAHGPNAALPHYRNTPETNRRLEPGTVYLVDSGGQYLDATTDITRTIGIGTVPHEIKERFTLVLKGHIAIGTALFPVGTTGSQIDILARMALWRHGLDFDHGTGHGIGAYLCVHEGPHRISKAGNSVALKPGMIVSNEPGYYEPGAYGIRIENLIVVENRPTPPGGNRPMLGFADLTLCPIDRRMIVTAMLSTEERRWVDAYHERVRAELAPLMDQQVDRDWLLAETQPL